MEEIAKTIRKRRLEMNLTQKELALLIGSHRTYITNLENEKQKSITSKMLYKIMDALNLKILYISESIRQ